jgi:hypothetical protein
MIYGWICAFQGDISLCEHQTNGKENVFHYVEFGWNKFDFLVTPRVWQNEVLLDLKEVQRWDMEQL